jgi:hypothetical protein
MCVADIDEEDETAAVGNATMMMTNQTADENMTGMTNSVTIRIWDWVPIYFGYYSFIYDGRINPLL